MAENSSKSQQYSITLVNHSSMSGAFAIFQKTPDILVPGMMSLAWMTKNTHPNTQVNFDWSTDYNFVWDETGELVPGITAEASQVVAADLTSANSIVLSYDEWGFSFSKTAAEANPGSLLIKEDATVPPMLASVGIGMSGSPTFLVQAQPNINLVFTPHPEYWVAFGNFSQGQVLEMDEINNCQQINFLPNTNHVKVTLNPDNTWSVNH